MKKSIKSVITKAWNSSTITTWFSYLCKPLSFIIVYPLLLKTMTAEDVTIWFLIGTITGLVAMLNFGFEPTFVRLIAYAVGGADLAQIREINKNKTNQRKSINWECVKEIYSTCNYIVNRITVFGFLVLATLGTYCMIKPISCSSHLIECWYAWLIVIVGITSSLWSLKYSIYLQGMNCVAMLRRWDGLFGLLLIAANFLVLKLGGNIALLITVGQIISLLNAARLRILSRQVFDNEISKFDICWKNPRVMEVAWPSAKRLGVSHIGSHGLIQLSAVILAQVAPSKEALNYLFCLRMVDLIRTFAQAPLNSKMPLFAKLKGENNFILLNRLIKKSMVITYWTIFLSVVIIGVAGNKLLAMLGCKIQIIDTKLWNMFGFCLLIERYVGMHQAIYTLTNKIISHITLIIFSITYVSLSLALSHNCGYYALPIAMIVAQLLSTIHVSKYSYKSIGANAVNFEKNVAIPPICAYGGYILCVGFGWIY